MSDRIEVYCSSEHRPHFQALVRGSYYNNSFGFYLRHDVEKWMKETFGTNWYILSGRVENVRSFRGSGSRTGWTKDARTAIIVFNNDADALVFKMKYEDELR